MTPPEPTWHDACGIEICHPPSRQQEVTQAVRQVDKEAKNEQAAKGVSNTFSIGRPDEKLPHKI